MVTDISLPFYEFVLDFLASGPTPWEIINFRPPAEILTRFQKLIAANQEQTLTSEENEELDHYIVIDRMISLLKAKAYRRFDAKSA
jgi:hypothetical protein